MGERLLKMKEINFDDILGLNLEQLGVQTSYLPFAIVYDKLRHQAQEHLIPLRQKIEESIDVQARNI